MDVKKYIFIILFLPAICLPSFVEGAELQWHVAGRSVPQLGPFDEIVHEYMRERNVPRGALAVTKGSRLLLAHGYTLGEVDSVTQPDSLFRIASLSKPLTAVGVLRLVQEGKLDLDQAVGAILDVEGASDPRFADVTVRQLLQHRGGWDRNQSFDPMFKDLEISETLSRPLPTTPQAVIDFMKLKPLDFEPGSRFAYSNFGYCLLGRVIEAVTGKTYEDYMRDEVFAPIGITEMRIGKSLRKDRLPNEVDYSVPQEYISANVMGEEGQVEGEYGGWNITTMDAHGGWVASAIDIARFLSALDDRKRSPLLSEEMIDVMWQRPEGGEPSEKVYNALGWLVREVGEGNGMNVWHTGSLPGTWTIMIKRHDGVNWVALFNQRSDGTDLPPSGDIDGMLHRAAGQVTDWDVADLWGRY